VRCTLVFSRFGATERQIASLPEPHLLELHNAHFNGNGGFGTKDVPITCSILDGSNNSPAAPARAEAGAPVATVGGGPSSMSGAPSSSRSTSTLADPCCCPVPRLSACWKACRSTVAGGVDDVTLVGLSEPAPPGPGGVPVAVDVPQAAAHGSAASGGMEAVSAPIPMVKAASGPAAKWPAPDETDSADAAAEGEAGESTEVMGEGAPKTGAAREGDRSRPAVAGMPR